MHRFFPVRKVRIDLHPDPAAIRPLSTPSTPSAFSRAVSCFWTHGRVLLWASLLLPIAPDALTAHSVHSASDPAPADSTRLNAPEPSPAASPASLDTVQAYLQRAIAQFPNPTPSAIDYAQAALSMSQELGDPLLESRSNMILAVSYYFKDFHSISNDYYRAALESPALPADSKDRANIHSNMGINYEFLGQYDLALASYRTSIEIDRRLGDERSIGATLINKALIYKAVSDLPRMRESLFEARAILEPLADTLNLALIDQNMSLYHAEIGNMDSLRWYAARAEAVYEQQGFTVGLMEVYSNQLHHFTVVQPDASAARRMVRRLRELDPEMRDGVMYSMLKLGEARLALLDGDVEAAKAALQIGIAAERSKPSPTRLPDYYREYFRVAIATGDLALFEQTFGEWRGFVDSLRASDRNRTLEELEVRFGLADAREQIALQQVELRLQRSQKRVLGLALGAALLAGFGVAAFLLWRQRELMALYRVNAQIVNPRSFALPAAREPNSEEPPNERETLLFNQILTLFEQESLHLHTGLTITNLASRLYSNETYVSQAIRNRSGLNFNGFVNQYRVNEAKRQLETASPGQSLDWIMQQSGFRSRSTFHQVFKEATGLTPNQYRELGRRAARTTEPSAPQYA